MNLAETLYELRRLADAEQTRSDDLSAKCRERKVRVDWDSVYCEQYAGRATAYRVAASMLETALGFPTRGLA